MSDQPIDTESRRALHELIDLLGEVDRRWVSPEWNLHTADDVVGAHRALMHYLQWGLVGLFERDPAAPRFHRIVAPDRKLLGDNPDAVYFDAPISADHAYRVTGETKGATYVSITVESGEAWGSMDNQVVGVLNDTSFDIDADGRFEILLDGEPRQRNWLALPEGAGSISTRHYFEDAAHAAADPARVPTMRIEVVPGGGDHDGTPAAPDPGGSPADHDGNPVIPGVAPPITMATRHPRRQPRRSRWQPRHPRRQPRRSRWQPRHPRRQPRRSRWHPRHPRRQPRRPRPQPRHPRRQPRRSRWQPRHPRRQPRRSRPHPRHPRRQPRRSRPHPRHPRQHLLDPRHHPAASPVGRHRGRAGIRRVAGLVRELTVDRPPTGQSQPRSWISRVPNEFPPPGKPGDLGLAAFDAAYAMAPFLIGPDEALVIRARWPQCRYANVCLWNRHLQTFDYASRSISLNRAQTVADADGRFTAVIAHTDPGTPNWLDTEGRPFGIVYWRFMLPEGEIETPQAEVIPLSDLIAAAGSITLTSKTCLEPSARFPAPRSSADVLDEDRG